MSRIDDILEDISPKHLFHKDGLITNVKYNTSVAEAKSELLQAVLEVIGEDEKFKNVYQWQQAEPLNLLRQELRTKFKELFGVEE